MTRMTDEEFERNVSGEQPYPSDEQEMVDEARRARSEEARLLKECAEKDAEIERLRRILAEAQEQRTHIAKMAEWREMQIVEKAATSKALADALARIEQISLQGARADVLQIKAIISNLRRDRVLP